jgi:hypothetical protein
MGFRHRSAEQRHRSLFHGKPNDGAASQHFTGDVLHTDFIVQLDVLSQGRDGGHIRQPGFIARSAFEPADRNWPALSTLVQPAMGVYMESISALRTKIKPLPSGP